MSLEFRNNIKSVFDSIAQMDNDFVLDIITRIAIKMRGVKLLMQDCESKLNDQQLIRYELPFEIINEL